MMWMLVKLDATARILRRAVCASGTLSGEDVTVRWARMAISQLQPKIKRAAGGGCLGMRCSGNEAEMHLLRHLLTTEFRPSSYRLRLLPWRGAFGMITRTASPISATATREGNAWNVTSNWLPSLTHQSSGTCEAYRPRSRYPTCTQICHNKRTLSDAIAPCSLYQPLNGCVEAEQMIIARKRQ